MGLYVRQDEKRSELQQRIAAELREKAKRSGAGEGDGGVDLPDGVNDSRYLENTKQTTSLARVWAVIAVLAFIVAVLFMIQLAS